MGTFVMRTVPSGVKFDLYAANGQTILTSEVYRTAAACRYSYRAQYNRIDGGKLATQPDSGNTVTSQLSNHNLIDHTK